MDLPVYIDTSVIDAETVAPLSTTRRPIFSHTETGTRSHSDGNPLVVVRLDRASCVGAGDRTYHPGYQRYSGPSNHKQSLHSFSLYLHGDSLPRPVGDSVAHLPSALSPRRRCRYARHCAHPSAPRTQIASRMNGGTYTLSGTIITLGISLGTWGNLPGQDTGAMS